MYLIAQKIIFAPFIPQKSFDFLHNEVGYPHRSILHAPELLLLSSELPMRRARLAFLKVVQRDVFRREDPLYVPPRGLMASSDEEFCRDHARVPISVFNEFLKTL